MGAENTTRPGISLESLAVDNPYPIYEKMRTHYPVCELEPGGVWAITRHCDVKDALQNPELFSSAAQKALIQPKGLSDDCKRDLFILVQDPPEHTKYRALMHKAFSGSAIQALLPFMKKAAMEQMEKIRSLKNVDFLKDFAEPYIKKTASRITGIEDEENLEELCHWVQQNAQNLSESPSPEYIRNLEATIRAQNAYLDTVIHDRRENPRDDVISSLVHANLDGEHLTDSQLRNALELIIVAGIHTPVQAICHAIVWLAENPSLKNQLVAEPDKIRPFAEELLRYKSIAPALLRLTTQEVEVAGVTIPANQQVFMILASANHDPAEFPNPDTFDISRPNMKQHMAFGHGPHICIGAALSRQQIEIAIETIINNFSTISIPADAEIETNDSWIMRALTKVPISFE